jgi:hypothetical protein
MVVRFPKKSSPSGHGDRTGNEDLVSSAVRPALGPELSAAIWTGLSTNWQEKRAKAFTVEDAVLYATEL